MSQTGAIPLALGIGGAIISTALGAGPAIGFMAGSTVGTLFFGPGTDDVTQSGPRLSDLAVTSSAYGRTIPTILGTARIGGNVIASSDKLETKYEQSVGKGLGGGQDVETFRYRVHFMWAACRGDGTQQLLKIYADKKLIYDATNQTGTLQGGATQAQPGFDFRWLPGGADQSVDPKIEDLFDEDNVPAYRQLACIMFEDFQLEAYGNRVPQIEAIISSTADPVYPFIDVTFLPGNINSFTTGRMLVDWRRHRWYLVDNTGSGGNTEGIRIFDTRTMDEIQQVFENDITADSPPGVTGSGGHGLLAVNPIDGSLVSNGSGGNASPIYRLDPQTYRATHQFGASGLGLGFGPTSFQTLQRGSCAACFGLTGPRVFFLCRGVLGSSVGILDADTMEYIHDFTTGAGNPIFFIPLPPQPEYAVCYVVCEQSANAHRIIKVTLHYNATYTFSEIIQQPIGVEVETVADLLQEDYAGGAAVSSSVEGGWWDPTDDTLVLHFATDTNTDFIAKYDPNDDSQVWITALPLNSARMNHLACEYDLIVNSTLGWIANGPKTVFKVDLRSGEIITTITQAQASDWLTDHEGLQCYNGYEDSIISGGRDKIFIGRIGDQGITLQAAVETILGQAGYTSDEYDMSALAGVTFPGYVMSRPSNARQFLEQLSSAFFFSIVESDYVLKGVLKSAPDTVQITEDDLGQVSGELEGTPLIVERIQEEELPGEVTLLHSEPSRDYQTGTQNVKRVALPDLYTMQSDHNMVVEMPVMLEADDARQMAEKMLFTAWVERNNFQLVLPWKYLALDPADVIELTLDDGSVFSIRAVTIDIGANMTIEVRGVADDAPTFTSTITGAAGDGFKDKALFTPVPTELFILQTPLLRDADDRGRTATVFYAAAGAYDAGWTAAFLYESPDGATYVQAGVFLNDSTWGGTIGAVPSPPDDNPFVLDTVTEIVVKVVTPGATLSSVTMDTLLSDEGVNACLIGEEIIRFQNATDNGDGTYTLDTLLRGRRGTDYAIAEHTVGERFVLLDQATIIRLEKDLGLVGATRYYKGVSVGESLIDVLGIPTVLQGNDMKPYAPAAITRDDTSSAPDIEVSWLRRSRVDNELKDGVDEPALNEDDEQYEAYILLGEFDPGTFDADDTTTYVRSYTGLTSPTFTYTEAEQIADDFAPSGALFVVIFQVSTQVGRGWPGFAELQPNEFTYLLGEVAAEGTFGASTGDIYGQQYTVVIDSDIQALAVFLAGNSSGGSCRLSLYADTGANLPGALLGSTEFTYAAGHPLTWFTSELASPIGVSVGDKVWVAVQNSVSKTLGAPSSPVSTVRRSRSVSYGGAAPDPFSSTGAHGTTIAMRAVATPA